MVILDGNALSEKILKGLAERVQKFLRPPRLAAVLVGENPSSTAFVNIKEKACGALGIELRRYEYPSSISGATLSENLNQIVREGRADGIIVQLPLPSQLDKNRHSVLRIIPEELDVDAMTEQSLGRQMSGRFELQFRHGKVMLLSPFAKTLLAFFEAYDINPEGKHAVVVGWGDLIGKITVPMLIRAGATVSVCTERTKDIGFFTRHADILISGAGKPGLITADMVQDGAVVIDAGAAVVEGKQTGDVDFEAVSQKARYITPPIGGVGPMVVAMLLANVVDFAEARRGRT